MMINNVCCVVVLSSYYYYYYFIIIIIIVLMLLVVLVALLLHHYDCNMNYMHSLSNYYTFHPPIPITLNVLPAAQFSCQRSTLNSDLKGREINMDFLSYFSSWFDYFMSMMVGFKTKKLL